MSSDGLLAACVVFLCLALPLSIAGANIGLAALSALALKPLFSGRNAWKREWNPVIGALVAYSVVGLLASAAGIEPSRSLREAAKDWHKPWALAALLLTLGSASKARVEKTLAAGFAAAAIIGLWQSATQRAGTAWLRAHAFVHPVTYGEMMAAAVLGGLCFWGRSEAGLQSASAKRWTTGFLALSCAALVLSQTRGAILGLAAGFAAVCLLDKALRRWALPVAGAMAAIVGLWELMPTGGRSLSALLHFQTRYADGVYNPYLARFELWSVAWHVFKDHPLCGVGPGNYNTVFTRYFKGSLDNESVWGSAHNLYLQQLAERGLVGLTALVAALAALTGRAFSRARRIPNAWNLWAWGAWTAFLVMNLTEVAFQNELVTTLFLFIWAWSEINKDAPAGKSSYA